MSAIRFLYTTAPNLQAAEALAGRLIDGRLAACVNILPGVRAIYRWQGAVETAEEVAMIVKTSADAAIAAGALIRKAHPYATPSISVFAATEGTDADFAAWVVAECDQSAASEKKPDP